jgi:hypothetical protein
MSHGCFGSDRFLSGKKLADSPTLLDDKRDITYLMDQITNLQYALAPIDFRLYSVRMQKSVQTTYRHSSQVLEQL